MDLSSDGYLDRYQAAALVGVHPETILRWARDGQIDKHERSVRQAKRKYYFKREQLLVVKRAREALKS